jgi:enoyl-CoA hydratase/carnithine racemase
LAIVADIGTLQRLPKLIGEQRARDLSYTGRNVSGKEAFEMGLVLSPPFKTEAEMLKAVHEKAEVIASKSPLTIRGVKSSLNFSRDHSVAEGLNHVKMHNAAFLYSSDLLTAMTGGKTFKGN